jgi:hypothetical protein
VETRCREGFRFHHALLWISYSQAIVYSYDGPSVGSSNAAGNVLDIVGKYDSAAQLFSSSTTFGHNTSGTLAGGNWLVVSNGPNPKDLAPGSGFRFWHDRASTTPSIEFFSFA